VSTLRLDAYQALLDVPVRNAWLHALYLEPEHTALLDGFYVASASSSSWVQGTLRHQLRRAAEGEILKTSSSSSGAGAGELDEDAVYSAAKDALNALASLLAESETDWFFGAAAPTLFDASVFAYTYLMRQLPNSDDEGTEARLGTLVRKAGSGELERHQQWIFKMLWTSKTEDGSGTLGS
jgi:metaxin